MEPLFVDAGSAVVVAFSFMLEAADREASLVDLETAGLAYGLTVYPDPCGGDPIMGPSGMDPTKSDFGATIEVGKWYRGEIRYNHAASGKWTGEVRLGGVAIGTASDIFPPGIQKELDVTIRSGLSRLGRQGVSKVDIDDMIMTRAATP